MKFKFLFIAGLVVGTISTSLAQNISLDPAVRTAKLSNGFTYYTP
jgi:hypothetical protein